jgi:hypothetical protein
MYIGPDTNQFAWRDLYYDLLDYEGDRWPEQVIWPWADGNSATIRELHEIGRPECRMARIRQSPGQVQSPRGLVRDEPGAGRAHRAVSARQ